MQNTKIFMLMEKRPAHTDFSGSVLYSICPWKRKLIEPLPPDATRDEPVETRPYMLDAAFVSGDQMLLPLKNTKKSESPPSDGPRKRRDPADISWRARWQRRCWLSI